MCGRFTQTKSREEILSKWEGVELPPLFHGRYNIAPTQTVAIIRQDEPTRTEACIWGFENSHSNAPIINARSETLTERPTFKHLLSTNRCLVPADGFYEWKGKQPYYFHLPGNPLFAFAGLRRDNRCVIITRSADENMQGIHHRMPSILHANTWTRWLEQSELPEPPKLAMHPVSHRVNHIRNDDPSCIGPIEVQHDLSLFPDDC